MPIRCSNSWTVHSSQKDHENLLQFYFLEVFILIKLGSSTKPAAQNGAYSVVVTEESSPNTQSPVRQESHENRWWWNHWVEESEFQAGKWLEATCIVRTHIHAYTHTHDANICTFVYKYAGSCHHASCASFTPRPFWMAGNSRYCLFVVASTMCVSRARLFQTCSVAKLRLLSKYNAYLDFSGKCYHVWMM